MYTVGQVCKKFGISRSALLYYESIGLVKSGKRTEGNYRLYSKEDITRLEQIFLYRETGIPLVDIKTLLDSPKNNASDILEKRLKSLNNEINKLKFQQHFIIKMLKNNDVPLEAAVISKDSFVDILKIIGLKEEEMDKLHREFERLYPEEHQTFLEFLGIPLDEIQLIREHSKKVFQQQNNR
ncbi:MerR family transcriptional regulator [Clostridium formicaceticum]|uniref:HTH-type transcriptional activator TipA n=1 Tax=Clostridium formicaceticum TaxID=1497 RepID=A0AAC9RI55_9CLOT|nr:MerR family transcriptional regulator [Clostridium formicaceticum]AOY77010.1 MerR family transcriptional regulator [Clostridium formicaceticum]ARE87501.1 HTH-type transcriptional activator TipA [Clostridium formicaceticum]